jgi:hypothetical protein
VTNTPLTPEPPPPPPPPPGPPDYRPPAGQYPPPGPPPKKGKSKLLIGLLACGGLFIAVIILGLIIGAVAPKPTTSTTATAGPAVSQSQASTTTEPATTTTAAPDQPYSGSADQVVTLPGGLKDARLAVVSYQGARNFVVKALRSSGRDDLLVNTIGHYSGTVAVNFDGAGVDGFEITASGPWTLTLRDLTAARELPSSSGGSIDGTGDDVVLFRPAKRAPLAISCKACTGNFVVRAIGERADLLVNEIGAYGGTVLAPAGTVLLEVTATGAWSVTVQ